MCAMACGASTYNFCGFHRDGIHQMSRGSADALLAQLGQSMGLAGLCLDSAGCCQLAFDQRWLVTVTHHAAGGRLVLHCPLCAAGGAEQLGRDTLIALLEGNFMNRAAATLAISPDKRACLQIELPLAGADGPSLHNALEQLLNLAETWARRVERGDAASSGGAEREPRHWLGQRV